MFSNVKENNSLPMIMLMLFMINEYARPVIFARYGLLLPIELYFLCFLILNHRDIGVLNDINKIWAFFILELFVHVFIASNNYWAFNLFKSSFSYFLFFLYVSVFINTKKKVNLLISVFLAVNIYCAALGLFHGGSIPGNAFMMDENDFALAMNVALPIALFFSFSMKGLSRYFLWACSLLLFLASSLSLSRGGMVGMAVIIFLILLKSNHKVITFAALFLCLTIFSLNTPEAYKEELRSIFDDGTTGGTARERLEFWKAATRAFATSPVLGIGQGNIPFRIAEFVGDSSYWEGMGKSAIGGRVVHSVYFTILAELGLVGVMVFFAFVRLLVRRYRTLTAELDDSDKLLVYGTMIAFAAFLSTGAFLSVLYYPHFWVLLTIANVIWLNRAAQTEQSARVVTL